MIIIRDRGRDRPAYRYRGDADIRVDSAVNTHVKFDVDVLRANIVTKIHVDAAADMLVEIGLNVHVEMTLSVRADIVVETCTC